jgi:ATP/maltotriose-dependent transcriptional regulator MalT
VPLSYHNLTLLEKCGMQVKGHNRNIYGKLQVQRRTEAVARARELGLL